MGFVEPQANRSEGVNVDTFAQSWLVANESPELSGKCRGQAVRERRQQDAGVWRRTGKVSCAMECDNRFARPRRAGDSCRPSIIALNDLLLLGMQKYSPLLPRKIEG